MRTTQRDQVGMTTFGAIVTDAASGSGTLLPSGVPFTFTRPITGEYNINFDTRLDPQYCHVSNVAGTTAMSRFVSIAAGNIAFRLYNTAGALANDNFSFSFTAMDKRL